MGTGGIKANGVVIDLYISPRRSPNPYEMRHSLTNTWVDRTKPEHLFHYFSQYDRPNVTFGYDLHVEPLQGTDEIRCTFSAFADTDELPDQAWRRDKYVPIVSLPPDLTPLVIKSGDVISIATLPLGGSGMAVTHYLRLTRTDPAPASNP